MGPRGDPPPRDFMGFWPRGVTFIITSVAAFYGYYVNGGALEVGKASTNAVVASSILILLLDVVLTKLLLQ